MGLPRNQQGWGKFNCENCWQAELLYNSYKHSVVKHKSVDGNRKI